MLDIRGSSGGQSEVEGSVYQISNLLLTCHTPTDIIEYFVRETAGLLREAAKQSSNA